MSVVQVVYEAARFWEGGARCFVGGSFGTLRWYPRLEHFCWTEDSNIICHEKGKRFRAPYAIAVDHYFFEAKKTTGSDDGTRLWKLRGING